MAPTMRIGAAALVLLLAPSAGSALFAQTRTALGPDVDGPGPLLQRPARLDVANVTLEAALIRLTQTSGVIVVFSPSLLRADARTVTCACRDASVGDALDALLAGTRFGYSLMDGQVALVPRYGAPRPAIRHGAPPVALASLGDRVLTTPEPAAGRGHAPGRAAAVSNAGTITGRVTDAATGQPLEGAAVRVERTRHRTVTRGDGQYTLTHVPAGVQTLAVSRIGFVEQARDVDVVADRTVTADFALDLSTLWVEEIVVTAQRRRQDIRDVPVSVTAIGAETLERQGIVNVREIARLTPGFTGSSFNESEPILALRGANNTFSQAGTSKPVGVFVDGVYVSRNSGSAFDLYDLEQVEVLRGPQGTLFGRNVTGGAILLTTARPEFGPTRARVDAGYGSLGAIDVRGSVEGNLGESAAGKLSTSVRRFDGYGRDRLTGVAQNDLDNWGLRGQLLIPAADRVTVRLIGERSEEKSHGRTLSTIEPAAADDGDIRTSEHGHAQRYERGITALSGHVSWQTSLGEIESITAYRRSSPYEDFAFSSTAFSLLPRLNPGFPFQQIGIARETPATISQEVRLASRRIGPADVVLGAYYFDETIDRQSTTVRLGGQQGDTLRDHTFDQAVETRSYAAYGDVHIAVTSALDLNVGGRLTRETKQVQVDYFDRLNPARNFRSDEFSESWTRITPRFALTWRPDRAVSLFASMTRGFTAGGFNTEEDNPDVIGRPFDPETITAYELGMKTGLFADRLRLNLTLFHQQYDAKQEGFLNAQFNFVIVNAAEATMDGVEAEVLWNPTPNLRLNATYAYLDATYDAFLIEHTGDDRSGNFLPTAPKRSYAIGGDWRLPLNGRGEMMLSAHHAWQDEYYTGSENRPTFLIDSYRVTDASVSYAPARGSWRLTAWGRNLTDEEYVLIRSDFGAGGIGEYFGSPRTYGIRLTLRL